MDKINNNIKIVIGVIVVVVLIVLAVVYNGNKSGTTNTTSSTTPGTASTGDQSASATPANAITASATNGTNTGASVPPAVIPPPIVIKLITPVKNDVWKIGGQNLISWDKEANFSGEIDLLDGTTGNFIGIILSETGAHQTSYTWNTRDYALARYSPLKKQLLPGTYMIRIKFDGNNLSTIVSPKITVTN